MKQIGSFFVLTLLLGTFFLILYTFFLKGSVMMLQIECKKKHCCTGSIFTFFSFSFIVYFSHRWTQHGSGMGGKRVNEHKWSRECGPRLFFFSCHTFLSLCFHSCLHFLPFLVMKGSPLLSMVSVPKRKQPFRWADTIS